MLFQWDQKNTAHIAEHGVSPEEAEYVVRRAVPPFPRRVPDGKSLVWGATDDGEFLQVIFVILEDDRVDVDGMSPAQVLSFADGEEVVYVVHAMPLTSSQKSQFRAMKRKKGQK
jgi:uncharacterized DUF497 family protein